MIVEKMCMRVIGGGGKESRRVADRRWVLRTADQDLVSRPLFASTGCVYQIALFTFMGLLFT